MSPAPPNTPVELAVVVISVGAPNLLRGAVASLLAQAVPVEIVVVNTGGGDVGAVLGDLAPSVRIVAREERLYPGAARNLGIAASRAEHVAFLASDCQADPGWAARRLARHKDGHLSVGSALLPTPDDRAVAWAAHLSLFVRRLPQASRLVALPYGASFHRSVFCDHGLFREDLRIGEDTEFASRLPPAAQPAWAPDVVARHVSPTRLGALLRDQFRRGRRAAEARRRTPRGEMPGVFAQWRARAVTPVRLARRMGLGRDGTIRRALALLPVCATAYCLGLSLPARRRPAPKG